MFDTIIAYNNKQQAGMANFNTEAFKNELIRILDYWEKYSKDNEHGGYYGQVGYDNQPDPNAARSIVLNARILWTFSMAHRIFKEVNYLTLADRAFQSIVKNFIDQEHGGAFWSVSPNGSPLETKKQVYGNAFAIYGLSEYYRITNHKPALEAAQNIYQLIEKHAFDTEKGGYLEAFSQDWTPTEEYILSSAPWIKSMNTHLHLVEAYTNLYSVWPDDQLKQQTKNMLLMIQKHIINSKTNSMQLFFDKNWKPKDTKISYGHDIEASWLLMETAEILHDPDLIETTKAIAIKMAHAVEPGLAADGALNYELDPVTNHLNTERSWWVLAEQMVGFYNAYQITGEEHFKRKSEKSWDYINSKFMDNTHGEWHGYVTPEGKPKLASKINFWKGPYHNARACAEMMRRISKEN